MPQELVWCLHVYPSQGLPPRIHLHACRDIRKVLDCEVFHLKTKPHRGAGGNTQIVVAWVPYRTVVPTMLFSHGNAVDLGQMLPFYRYVTPRQSGRNAIITRHTADCKSC